MELFTSEQVHRLANVQAEPCVTMYMPTIHVEADRLQNPIRLKNLIKRTRRLLEEQGHRETHVAKLLSPLNRLVENQTFWLDQGNGFAAFLTPDEAEYARLPITFEELVVVGGRFHLKPLFPLVNADYTYYVLTLSKNNVRLIRGTPFGATEVTSDEIPASIVDVLMVEERQRSLQHHTGNRFGGRQDQIFHGHGVQGGDESHRPHDEIVRFFRGIDEGVRETLGDDAAPLVLAGVEYYLPIYREVSRYRGLIDDSIVAGNPDRLKPRELHEKAWSLIEPRFRTSQEQSIEQFRQLNGNGQGLASTDVREIVPAAIFGRVDALFLKSGVHVWGRFDPEDNALEVRDEYRPGDEDLLDLAAVHTFLQSGVVYQLTSEEMPVPQHIGATFRYALDPAAQGR